MNLIPFLSQRADGQGPDALEHLLRDFFQAELPRRFPLPALPVVERPASSWWTRSRSRLALAASVALLVAGSWWLAGRTLAPSTPTIGLHGDKDSGTAGVGVRGKIIEHAKQQP